MRNKINKNIKKLVYSKDYHWVILNNIYLIDTRDGAIYWFEDVKRKDNDFPQWVFDVRNDLRDYGFVR